MSFRFIYVKKQSCRGYDLDLNDHFVSGYLNPVARWKNVRGGDARKTRDPTKFLNEGMDWQF